MISVTCWLSVTARLGGFWKVVITPQLVTVTGNPAAAVLAAPVGPAVGRSVTPQPATRSTDTRSCRSGSGCRLVMNGSL